MLGWSETALHLAFLLPALAVILGTHRLARRFCDRPMLAALAVLFTPVFLVSSATVMCDVLMLAFWVWAVVFWMEGLERDDFWRLPAAGLLIALAALTKYFGVCLIPLLAFYSGMGRRRFRQVGRVSAHPAAGALRLSMGHARALPARPPFASGGLRRSDARFFERRQSGHGFDRLAFTGGCLAAVVFLAPWLWRGRVLLALAGGAALLSMAVFLEGTLWQKYHWLQGTPGCPPKPR